MFRLLHLFRNDLEVLANLFPLVAKWECVTPLPLWYLLCHPDLVFILLISYNSYLTYLFFSKKITCLLFHLPRLFRNDLEVLASLFPLVAQRDHVTHLPLWYHLCHPDLVFLLYRVYRVYHQARVYRPSHFARVPHLDLAHRVDHLYRLGLGDQ